MPECSDWIIFGLGVLVTVGWAIYLYSFRPKLEVGTPELSKIDGHSIVVPIKNMRKTRKATRVKAEISIIVDDTTYHLINDSDDFAFLPANHVRKFKAYKPCNYLIDMLQMDFDSVVSLLNEQNSKLRIRVHATDGFSGLGETFEKYFNAQDQIFKLTDS
jgi:hypothetical protein